MISFSFRSASLTLVVVLLASCSGTLGSSHVRSTDADKWFVMASSAALGGGCNKPPQIVCTEPSPDVAIALAKTTNIGGGLDVAAHVPNAPVEGSLGATGALSLARAQTVAQLTNRLATIQLLRDALYRACEAYGNGALSEITYAIMLSRYDKLMVTLLSGELVAGNFGQSLAVLGLGAGGSSGTSSSKTAQDASNATASLKSVDDARQDVVAKQADLEAANAALAKCSPSNQACKDSTQNQVTASSKNLKAADQALSTAVTNARGAVAAFAESHASTVLAQGVGALVHQASADIAQALANVQRKYVENINADPIIVACLTALDRDEQRTDSMADTHRRLVTYCRDALPQIVLLQSDVLRTRLIADQSSLLHGCMTALDAAGSTDETLKATATKLVDFCRTNFMNILSTQAQLAASQKALEDARAALETRKLGDTRPIGDGAKAK